MAGIDKTNLVQSDETLFRILDSLREQEGAGVTEVAEDLDIAKSTVHRHLATLKKHNFVTVANGEYNIGLKFLYFGEHARRQKQIYEVTKEKTQELADVTSEKAWTVVEENGVAVYLHNALGNHPVKTYASVGDRTDLHHLAAGKAILAFLGEEKLDAIVDELTFEPRTENTITNEEQLRVELEEIREEGVAYNYQESIKGLNAIGAPIKRPEEGVFGALSISGPANRLTETKMREELAELLLGATNEIEISIQYV